MTNEHADSTADVEQFTAGQPPEVAVAATTPGVDDAERAVILLSHGILKQFQAVQEGKIVGMTEEIPLPLRQAQAHLARLYMKDRREDPVASVHELLSRCKKPLALWAPAPIATHEKYAAAVLIDPEYCVPSEDCEAIAELGGHLEDLVETQMHGQLMRALERLDVTEREAAYTFVRRFIAEHPLATRDEYRDVRNDPRLTSELAQSLERIYQPAHSELAIKGLVSRCSRCNGYSRRDGECVLASCRYATEKTFVGTSVPLTDALVTRPEILKYWCDPAQEELRLYRELLESIGDSVELYPHMDRCDVSIGDDIGIDVKDYRDPARLARKLNTELGGLRMYPRMILAVATRRAANKEYVPRLRELLQPALRRALEVKSVDDVVKALKG